MEDIKTFTGGLHTNFDEQNQPKNTYRDAYNWIRLEDGSLINEQGIAIIGWFPGYNIKGSIVSGEDIFVFVKTGNPAISLLGVINKDNVYENLAEIPNLETTSRIKGEVRLDYRGHRILYYIDVINRNPARIIDADDPVTVDIDETTKLFLDSELPKVTPIAIGEDGNLPTGVYQFTIRLLTSSTNATSCSLLTNIVPIVEEFKSVGTESYDGALPQTQANKSITLEATNLDSKYSFVQFIVLTYDSLTNTPKANIIGVVPIISNSVTFKYTSINQNDEELTLGEITVEPISYDSPKAINQKDSHLILANLKATNFNPAFQEVANNCVIKYVIKELDFTENISNISIGSTGGDGVVTFSPTSNQFNNYKGELNTTDFKGYQRGEIYSFAIVPIFKNLSFGYSYHIPPPNFFGSNTDADVVSKLLGTFICADSEYPTGLGYPTDTNVRYHKMPTVKQENLFEYSTGKIRVLGIEVSNIDLSGLTSQEQSDIIGYCITRELRTDENKTILAQGIAQPLYARYSGSGSSPLRVSAFAGKRGAITSKQVAFYSPETTIYTNNVSSATLIEPVALLEGEAHMVRDERIGGLNNEYAHMFMRYNICDNYGYGESTHGTQTIKSGTIVYVSPESGTISIPNATTQINGTGSNGFLHLETDADFNYWVDTTTHDLGGAGSAYPELIYSYDSGEGTSELLSFGVPSSTGNIKRSLFNLIAVRPDSYGGVLDKEYVLIGYKLLTDSSPTTIECYSGDTFINKTSIVSTTDVVYFDTDSSEDGNIEIRSLNYFWCESTINTAYRHHIPNGTVPYFPKDRNISLAAGGGILQYEPIYGHANGYNKQYSFENILKRFFSKPVIPIEPVEEYTNRIIYSEQAIEGEQFDAYRQFLTNNYHDIPKNKGEITNLFTYRSTLYAHTEQSLWKTSFNENITQVTNIGEVALGNGGIFNRPSIEVFPVTGGYAGSINPLATYNSPFGVFFVDGLQGKVFLFGESFEELDYGMKFFIQDSLRFVTLEGTENIGNIISTYDYKYDRWLLTINNSSSSPFINVRITISYSPKLKSWTCFHNYIPTHMVSVNQKILINRLDEMGILNEGDRGKYFTGTINPSTITFIPNESPIVAKTFDSLSIDSNSAFTKYVGNVEGNNTVKDLVIDDTWEFEPSATQQRITKENSEWRMHLPVNSDSARVKGKFANLKLEYNNLDNSRFIVKYITVKYRINAR